MELSKHFVAFIDILGFANYVKDNSLTPNKPLELLKQIDSISMDLMQPIRNLNRTVFSDNIVLSMMSKNTKPPFGYDHEYWSYLYYINNLQIYIITSIGVLPIRGGLSFGDFYYEKNEIIFGKAMIEAYDLERQHAFYPRIVVNPKFLDPNTYLAAHKKLSSLELPQLKPKEYEPEVLLRHYPVKYDFDGVLFCNYLSALYLFEDGWAIYSEEALRNHMRFIIKNLKLANNQNVYRKYAWMKNYHNWFCEPFEEFKKYIIPD